VQAVNTAPPSDGVLEATFRASSSESASTSSSLTPSTSPSEIAAGAVPSQTLGSALAAKLPVHLSPSATLAPASAAAAALMLALAASAALALPALAQRVRLLRATHGPPPFISLLERPG
jgi:hypothetical protein